MGKVKISAIVLFGGDYNKKLLQKCLNSVSWADETVKVDTDKLSGSFSEWRNKGAKLAKGDWLLYVDSDEEITSALRKEILSSVKQKILNISAFAIPRRNIFLGHEMKYGGWKPDYVLRLIKKDKLKGWKGDLHEQPEIEGEVGYLKQELIHRSHRSLSEMVNKTNEWSEIEARLLFDAGHPQMNIFRFFTVGVREFFYRGIKKLGFLDGTVGVIEIIYQSFSKMVTYAKLWEMQIKKGKDK